MWHVLHAILNVFGVLYTGLSDTFSCVLLTVTEITNSNSALQSIFMVLPNLTALGTCIDKGDVCILGEVEW